MKNKKLVFQRAYTLFEVLVVVVIIATLASLVIPRFTTQREKAAAAEAITIMSAIHRGLLIYHDEHNGYPTSLSTSNGTRQYLGVDFQAPSHGWSFKTDILGNVIATSQHGNLTLFENGTWGGDGNYTPGTGIYWPYLNQ